jgi:hypothetical protein
MTKSSRYLPMLLLFAGVSIAAPACAAQTYGYGYPRGGGDPRGGGVYGRDIQRRAYDNGYRQGLEEGRNDARGDRNYSYQRHNEYRDADNGYHRSDGDRDFYRRSFRQGFQAGYNDAYNRNARNRRDRDWRR